MENKTRSRAKNNGKVNLRSRAIGGTTMLGIGIGFILLPVSALFFVASVLSGIGIGLVITPLISRRSG